MLKENISPEQINADKTKEQKNDDPEIRRFVFNALIKENGDKLTVHTKHLGNIEDIYRKISRAQKEQAAVPAGALAIIDAFANCRKEFELDGGKKITRAPRLLIAGGFVRDVLLGKLPKDIDFATNFTAAEVKELLNGKLNNIKKMETQGECFQVVRVILERAEQANGDGAREEYEIATFREDSPESDGRRPLRVKPAKYAGKDAERRDLTVNALFYNTESGNVIDYVGGLDDIKNKKLRFVGDPGKRIAEDKLRLLRYARFLLKTGFTAGKKDREAVRSHASDINAIAKERIKDELEKMLQTFTADDVLKTLDNLDLLKATIPEVKALENCEQGPPYHLKGNVLKHTLTVGSNLPKDANLKLKWAAIFHDIAKPETREEKIINGKTKVSFLKHDELGAEKIKPILRRLNFSVKEINEIAWLILNHQFFFNKICGRIKRAGELNPDATAKAWQKSIGEIKNMIIDRGEDLVGDLAKLAVADNQATLSEPGLTEGDGKIITEAFNKTLQKITKEKEKGIDLKKLANGNDVMEIFQIKAGKKVGEILKIFNAMLLEDAALEDIKDADEARLYALKKLKESAGEILNQLT